MSNISKRKRDGARAKIRSMGDHDEFLKRITKTLYYGQLPSIPCLSLPVTELSCEVWSACARGRSVRRLHTDAAAGLARAAAVSPAALVLALLYVERLRRHRPAYLANTPPADLFLITLMVGNKFLQDDGEDEEVICSEWAASGGMELDQLKKLELEFLSAIDWNVFVSSQSFSSGLSWLEREVALREARRRGFFTYTELAAASDAALAAAARAAASHAAAGALACLAALLALAAAALALSPPIPPRSPPAPATPTPAPAFPPPLTLSQYVPNSTQEAELLVSTARPTCCWHATAEADSADLEATDVWAQWTVAPLRWLAPSVPRGVRCPVAPPLGRGGLGALLIAVSDR